MKKLIIGICFITFFLFIFNSKTIKIIGFYQDLDILKTNTLFYEEDKKAAYYKIYIYDESDNLLDIKKTKNNYYKLNFIKDLKEKMYIKVISYNNKNKEIKESKKYYIQWNLPYLEVIDNKVMINNYLNENYEIIVSKNKNIIDNIKNNTNIENYDNVEINLYQDNILINKLYLNKTNFNKVLYPLNNMTINPQDFYVNIKTNYNCSLTLKNKNKILFEGVYNCEYLVSKELLTENEEYELKIEYLLNDSFFPISEDIIKFKIGEKQKLLSVLSSIPSGEILKNSLLELKSPNNASIYYTLDGSIPDKNSYKYEEAIELKEDTILNAIAINDKDSSEVTTLKYQVTDKVPFIYLSPSRQTRNLGVKRAGYSNEKIEMNKLAVILEKKLLAQGMKVYRAEQSQDLDERVKESIKLNADIYLALHSNASTSGYPKEGSARGIQSYIASPESNILDFAKIVQKELMNIYEGPTNRSGVKFGTQTKMMFEINEENVKNGILLEIGFHDNYEDAYWIINNLDEIADAITLAIAKYFKM